MARLRHGGTNIVPAGTPLHNVAQCAGLKIPSNVITAAPAPHLSESPVPRATTMSSKQPPKHHQQQPPDSFVPPMELKNKLSRKVRPQKLNRLSELMKLFELTPDEDNLRVPKYSYRPIVPKIRTQYRPNFNQNTDLQA